jgi:glycine/D-amino acid oxidase-like deaminating enzyme
VLEKNFIAAGATGKSSACVRQHYSTEVGARMVMRSLEIFQNFSEIVGGPAGFVKTGYLMGVGERDHQALKKVIAMQQGGGNQDLAVVAERNQGNRAAGVDS